MSYSGNVRPVGSARVSAANALVANSGWFNEDTFVNNGVGDNTLGLDPDTARVNARTTFQVTLEGTTAGTAAVERVDEVNVRVRTFNAAGAALDTAYAIDVNETFEG